MTHKLMDASLEMIASRSMMYSVLENDRCSASLHEADADTNDTAGSN